MYKKILLNTVLSADLSRSDSYISLPVDLGLGSDDWTYLTLMGAGTEIVKVVRSQTGRYAIVRGLEGTKPQGFVAGDIVKYSLTVAELLDRQVSPLTMDYLGAVRVHSNKVSIPSLTLIGLGGVQDGFPIRRRVITECCKDNQPPPLPPVGLRMTGDGKFRSLDDERARLVR